MIKAEILNIGDEILYGQITNTNAQWISAELDKIGIRVVRHSVVSDTEEAILEGLQEAEKRADVVLITGGLGPTKDDITKKTLCKFFDVKLIRHPEALRAVTHFFESRGREMLEVNRQQADLPENAEYIPNLKGTAPGMWFEKNGKIFVSMPGVPHEMQFIMQSYVLENLQKFFHTPCIVHKMIKTVGIGESYLAREIETWENNLPENLKLAYLPAFGMVRLRITGLGYDQEAVRRQIEQEVDKVLPLIDKYVYGFDDDDLAIAVGRLLVQNKKTLAIAESCTGGYLAHCFTQHAGSSEYLKGALVAYSNEIKINVLGVKKETIEQFGAVSEQTVLEMASNIRKLCNADIGIATSGIAGPGGATPTKPVGTIWVAYADENGTSAKLYQLGNDRMVNIQVTANLLIDWLRRKQGGRVK
ncbi:competence/damage-inducible protein A [Raineya orbicola]|uniref:CinA-like protein n=1 Tax=Raineya orbicola TaxID=2016530 RepID=A0A2N3IIT4_9BACT|nr:competence/damage-inducible protein A [Raineya orbicola]PKQ70206.1 Competence/damage-inducible protein CinA N-terminal domain [Raineya orbicola]